MWSYFANYLGALAPRACLACKQSSMSALFCERCFEELERTPQQKTQEMATIFYYKGPIAQAIKRAKFAPHEITARSLAFLIDKDTVSVNQEVDAITFVPLHWRRRLQRGFDLSCIFAQRIACIT